MTANMRIQTSKMLRCIFLLPAVGISSLLADEEDETIVLETFILNETESALVDTVMPTDREISGLFGDSVSVFEVPRSVTLLSPEILDKFNIDDLRDLEKIGAGTQAINYYGVPGAPTIRGVRGGTYLNGMLRAFNRNEMPLSFGSLEAIEVVKGPAPADYSPTLVGGFVNLIPKSPFFDEESGSIELEVDNWGRKTVTADYGSPFLLPGEIPAAFRVSITSQDGESYYDNFANDFTSVYASMKFRPKDGMSVFVGGEYFDYKSNENAGWNRPTQELIDDGQYVIGEAINITNGNNLGFADRNQVSNDVALALERSVAEALVPQFGDINDMAFIVDSDGVEKYVYTQQYFDNGGQAVTQSIDGNEVLTDPSDFADSTNIVLFGDLVFDSNSDRIFTIKGLAESLETEKLSSYGYAFDSEQTVLATKAFITERTLIPFTTVNLGVSLRYTDAKQLQDFWVEPFSRRDITQPIISANSIILAGGQTTLDGVNFWDGGFGGIGGNVESELMQYALFANSQSKLLDDRLTINASVRGEIAEFDADVPSELQSVDPLDIIAFEDDGDGDTDFINFSLGFNLETIEGVFLYGNYQEGTSMDPTQGGAVVGEANFADNEMWEVGVKAGLLDNKLYASIAYYEWEQSAFNGRSGASEALEGDGIEVEATWLVTDQLTVIGSFTSQEVRRLDPLPFRTIPFSEADWALYGGELNSNFGTGSFDGRDRYVDGNFGIPPENTDLVYPGTPEQVFKLFAAYDFENGFEITASMIYQEEFFLDFDHQIELPDALIFGIGAKYSTEKWEIGASIENLTDEDYFLGSDPVFAANTLVTKAPERTYIFSFKYKF